MNNLHEEMVVGGSHYRNCCVLCENVGQGRGGAGDLIHGFSPLNPQLGVSLGLGGKERHSPTLLV